ncbi:MAG: hypothetical protein Q8L93_05265 [Rhodocyclaceae bacterium]|nr:hypothetical protein [Rhodocyclaceae bacterium]
MLLLLPLRQRLIRGAGCASCLPYQTAIVPMLNGTSSTSWKFKLHPATGRAASRLPHIPANRNFSPRTARKAKGNISPGPVVLAVAVVVVVVAVADRPKPGPTIKTSRARLDLPIAPA